MKVFVCEFVTGGGLYRDPLAPSLVQEGELMLGAMLRGLSALDIDITTTRDYRLPALENVESVQVTPDLDVWAVWSECMKQAEAVWPLAPESDGMLARLCEMALQHGKQLLASSPAAISLTASKLSTAKHLEAAGLCVVKTVSTENLHQLPGGAVVVKPDDGVSCEGSQIFESPALLYEWLVAQPYPERLVIQPLHPGIPASISMLCMHGRAWLLSCNRQLVEQDGRGFRYCGSVLNGMQEHWEAFEQIAACVAAAIPELAGYIGVDVMVEGDRIQVLEVNPRLTTSYAGLEQAIGCNPASLIVDMFYNGSFSSPPKLERNIVEVRLSE